MSLGRDIDNTFSNMQDEMGKTAKTSLIAGAAITAGAIGLGVAATKSKRIRLKLMGFLHFPVALIISFAALILITFKYIYPLKSTSADTIYSVSYWVLLASAVIAIIWTLIFVKKYVKPRLKK